MSLRWGPPISLRPLPEALSAYQPAIDSRPLLMAQEWLHSLLELQYLLLQALQGLLQQETTADFLGLTGKARDQIRQASQRPLHVGCVRPDLIVDDRGRAQVCEINARFPVNGFLCSAYLSDQFGEALPQFRPACSGQGIRRALHLPAGSCIVKGREPGWDIHQLSQEHAAPIVPQLPEHAAEVVLELHQEELLELPGVPQQTYWNDLRTQWLGHDKRLLQLLADPAMTERWLGDRADTLARGIVPTRCVHAGAPRHSVLKPNRSGKGRGLVFGCELSDEQWRQELAQAPAEWVVQPLVESLTVEQERLVFTMLSRDQESLGLGIVRSSPQRIVNVSGGGRVLFPMTDGA